MSNAEYSYLAILERIMEDGFKRRDRTGVGTRALFGQNIRHNFDEGFPLLTTKRVPMRWVAEELFWFLNGDHNVQNLRDKGVHIWDDNAKAEYWQDNKYKHHEWDVGRNYGVQWRNWSSSQPGAHIDQISNLMSGIRENPTSRRHVVTAWNPDDLDKTALPPCHILFQVHVHNPHISLEMYQRSCDMFLGVPFNIASYGLLTKLIANQTGYKAHELIIHLGDAHVYNNHTDQVKKQLSRRAQSLPSLELNKADSILDYTWNDIELNNYDPYPSIDAEMAV